MKIELIGGRYDGLKIDDLGASKIVFPSVTASSAEWSTTNAASNPVDAGLVYIRRGNAFHLATEGAE